MFDVIESVSASLVTGFFVYLPHLLGGFVILLVGLIVAASVKKLVLVLLRILRLEKWLEEAGLGTGKQVRVWAELFAELIRWTVVVVFLIPAAETWGIPRVTTVLNQLLIYVPNVFIAAIVGLVGAVAARFVSDIVENSSNAMGSKSSNVLAVISRYAILFFTGLIILNQLGVASDLIRILFTGIVAMLALAGGLAFGLGGKELAKDLLEQLRKKLQ